MRVLQVDSGREWRGGQNQVRLLCRELTREGEIDLVLATRRDGELARRAARDGVTVRGTSWGIGLDPRAWWGIRAAIRTFTPQIVHAHDSHALRLAAAAVGRGGARLVATRRVDFHVRRGSVWHAVERTIAISDAVKQVLVSDGIAPERIAVVPSGIDSEEVHRDAARPLNVRGRLAIPAGAPLVANVAALVDHKDQLTLIRAARAARAHRPDLHWVIAGEGERRGSLAAEIARLELADRVHLVGYIEEADALIREADVFVMSSKEEGLGSVVLNALALGKPVVATRGGGLPEMLPPDALVPVGDAAALGRKVVETLAHPSPVSLPPQFTASAMAAGVLAVYRSLV